MTLVIKHIHNLLPHLKHETCFYTVPQKMRQLWQAVVSTSMD